MKSIYSLGVKNDNKGLDYFLPSEINLEFNTKQKFIAWSIGASNIYKKVHNFLKHLFLIRLDLKSLHLHNH